MVFQEEVLTPLKKSHSAESQLQAATSASFDSGVGGLSSTSQFANQSSISQLEGTSSTLLSFATHSSIGEEWIFHPYYWIVVLWEGQ